jgi:AcrR family transcriptional regulator
MREVPKSERKPETRRAILEAGSRALASYGYRKLSMEDIAREAGLTRRTLYAYFGSKEEICRAVLDAMRERLYERMDQAMERPGKGSDRLREVLLTRLWGRVESTLPYHHSLADAVEAVYPRRGESFHELAAPDAERLARAIRLGHEDGSLGSCDPEEMAEVLVRGSNGFFPSSVGAAGLESIETLRRQIETYVDVLVKGLAAR